MNHMNNSIFPHTTKRVFLNTHPKDNAKIRHHTIARLDSYKHSSNQVLTDKIEKLNSEWDTERFLEANAASIVMVSTLLGLKHSKYWFLITGAVGLFLLQHALQGWCPPVPFIRKRGMRTSEEINNERIALKILRKDFSEVNSCDVSEILSIVEKD